MKTNKADCATIYSINYIKALREFQKTNNRQQLYNAVYYGVKSFVHEKDTNPLNVRDSKFLFDDLTIKYENMSHVIGFIQYLTPNELLRIFPIRKFYGGNRSGTKDYFYTMDTLQCHGLDTPIGHQVYSILYDYTNIEISLFLTKMFSVISQIDIMRR
ncbi:MAG: hypothetical protein ACK5MV_13935 [Aminipila sp.]